MTRLNVTARRENIKGPKLIVALDLPTIGDAAGICDLLMPEVSFFKVGLSLFCAEGPNAVSVLKSMGASIFLDLKLHDIPAQIRKTASIIGSLGVDIVSVHCLGGRAMLRAAKAGINEGSQKAGLKPPMVVGVTVLTSLDAADMENMGISGQLEIEVGILAGLAKDAGLDGVVASARDLTTLRTEFRGDFIKITPGVRPEWASAMDQKRVLTPKEAARAGSTFVVVGRPIIEAPDPKAAALRILDELS